MNNNNNISWQKSMSRYNQLNEALNELICDTAKLAKLYEDTNMAFAQLIYEKGLYELMKQANTLNNYEKNFEFMYHNLQGQVGHLKRLKETMQMFQIKDPVNCPSN